MLKRRCRIFLTGGGYSNSASMKVPFFRHSLTDEDRTRVNRVLQTPFLTTGPVTREFEEKFANYLGVKQAVAVSSWTTGAFLLLKALGIGEDDEVITSPLSFIASANIIVHAGATPVFVDVDSQTGNLDLNRLEAAITPRTRAILPVHLYGQMADVEKLRDICKQRNLHLIEDAAHAVESQWRGMRPGQCSTAACFSFYATKNLTCGEGGAIVTNDEGLADSLRKLRLHGMSRSAADRYTSQYYQHYDMEVLGYKCNLNDIQSALLIGQIDRLEAQLQRRECIADKYNTVFDAKLKRPAILQEGRSARHLYTLWVDPLLRDQFLKALNDRQIGVAVNFRAIHLMSYYQKTFGYQRGCFPVAETIGDSTFTLPFYPAITEEEIQTVITAVLDTNTKLTQTS